MQKKLLILAIVSLCFRVITYFIQQPYKRKFENKNKIMRNRHKKSQKITYNFDKR